jgi:AcrR family transcriptional regulator
MGARVAEGPGTQPAAPADLSPRERIREALMDLAVELGWEGLTLEAVLERADVERAEFERHFDGLEDCYLQIYRENAAEFETPLIAAFDAGPTWREGARAAVYLAARHIRDHPRGAAFSLLQRFNVDDLIQEHRERQMRMIVERIDLGRQEMDDPDSLSPQVAEGIMGSIFEMLMGEFQRGNGDRIEEFVPTVMYVGVLPYLGHEAALEELTIPPPPDPSKGGD